MRKTMRRALAFLIVASLLTSTLMFTTALASNEEEKSNELIAAEALHSIGLFLGLGDDADGNPVFGLEKGATRIQGLIMLLRLFGEYEDALNSEYEHPFVDVTDSYNSKIVAYAYEKGYTKGVSATLFEPAGELSAAHYLTFILRALGYEDGTDFTWNAAWALTDKLGITHGEFGATNNDLLRGSLAIASLLALEQKLKGSNETLLDKLIGMEAVPEDAAGKTSAAATTIKENIKQAAPTATPTPAPTPAPGSSGGNSSGGPTPTPIPKTYLVDIEGAEVGDYVWWLELKPNDYSYTYVEVKTAGQITVNKAGTFAWDIIGAEYIILSEGGKTVNLDSVMDLVLDVSLGQGDHIDLFNLTDPGWTGFLEIDETGQVAIPDGNYLLDEYYEYYIAYEIIHSVNGKTTDLDGEPGGFVQFRNLGNYSHTGFFEVGEDGEVAIESGKYVVYTWIAPKDVVVSKSGKTENLDGNPGDFIRLFNLNTGEYKLPLKVGEDGEVAIADGKYERGRLVDSEDVLVPVDGKITIPEDYRDEGNAVEFVELEGLVWYLKEADEEWQVEVPGGKHYYIDDTYPLLNSVGGKISDLGSFGLSEFDYVYLFGFDYHNDGEYRVNGNGEVIAPTGKYALVDIYLASDWVSSVNGRTANFKEKCDEREYLYGYEIEYEEGDYVWLGTIAGSNLWGYFMVGADGEVAIADGLYYHWWGNFIPAAYVITVS